MSKFIIALVALVTVGTFFFNLRTPLANVRNANEQLLSQVRVLRAQSAKLEERRSGLQRQVRASQDRRRALPEAPVAAPARESGGIASLDPARRGGWPAHAQYFYLPKEDLLSVGYRLFQGNRLTDDAATLFGMTTAERQAADAAYDDMWRRFREIEIQGMEPVEKPKKWTHGEKGISYRIPSLEKEARGSRSSFESSLQQTLGITRGQYLLEAAGEHISTKLDDLGGDARIISFFQVHQPNGDRQMMYASLNERTGIGWARVIQEPLEEDSQAAYYARLFGIDVPIKGN